MHHHEDNDPHKETGKPSTTSSLARPIHQQQQLLGEELPWLPHQLPLLQVQFKVVSATDVQLVRKSTDDELLVVGWGQYGVVALGRHPITGRHLVVKMMYRGRSNRQQVLQEARVLHVTSSTGASPRFHGVAMLGYGANSANQRSLFWREALVMDFVGDQRTLLVTSLYDYVQYLRSRRYFCDNFSQLWNTTQASREVQSVHLARGMSSVPKEADIFYIVRHLAQSLEELHRHGVVLNDIKLDNILLQRIQGGIWRPYVIDMGMAKMSPDYRTDYRIPKSIEGREQFSRQFHQVAPEVVWSGTCSAGSDVYSLGWVLLYLGQSLGLEGLVHLAHSCLSRHAEIRPTAGQLTHQLSQLAMQAGRRTFLAWVLMLRERNFFRLNVPYMCHI